MRPYPDLSHSLREWVLLEWFLLSTFIPRAFVTLFHPSNFRTVSHALPRIPLALLLTLGLAISSCQNNTRNPSQPTSGTVSPPAADPEVVVVRGLTQGDRACYMELEDAKGQRSEEEASFEICEQAQLVGQRVQLTREPTSILAMSCQGDPECTQRDTVDLIITAEVVP